MAPYVENERLRHAAYKGLKMRLCEARPAACAFNVYQTAYLKYQRALIPLSRLRKNGKSIYFELNENYDKTGTVKGEQQCR